MKKSLFLLPLLASLALVSCGEKKGGNDDDGGDEPQISAVQELTEGGYLKAEYNGYKLVEKPTDGHEYLIGIYKHNKDKMTFVNGNYHSDSKGTYEYYMSTSEGTADAAKVVVKFTGTDTFRLQVKAPGKAWDNKWIGIYAASSSYGNNVWSIAHLDTEGQATFTPTGKQTAEKAYSDFTYVERFEDNAAAAFAVMVADSRADEDVATPKFFGTGIPKTGEYVSMDCAAYGKALDHDTYDLAHFYEKIA